MAKLSIGLSNAETQQFFATVKAQGLFSNVENTADDIKTVLEALHVEDGNSGTAKTIWTGTQAEFDAIATKDDDTIYFVTA